MWAPYLQKSTRLLPSIRSTAGHGTAGCRRRSVCFASSSHPSARRFLAFEQPECPSPLGRLRTARPTATEMDALEEQAHVSSPNIYRTLAMHDRLGSYVRASWSRKVTSGGALTSMLVGHVFVTEGVIYALSRSFAAASSHVRGTVKPRITLQELCQGGVPQFAQKPNPH